MRSSNRLTIRILGGFAALDLVFKALIFPPFTYSAGLDAWSDRWHATRLLVAVMVPTFVVWGSAIALLLRPVERWLGDPEVADPEVVRRAGVRLHQLPAAFAVLWAAEWSVVFPLLTLLLGVSPLSPQLLLFSGAMVLGPLPLAYAITLRWLSGTTARASITARRLGVVLRPPSMTLRREMAVFSLCLAVAPSLYAGSVTLAARTVVVPIGELALLVTLFFGAIGLFAVLCAWFFSDAIATPVDRMAEVIRTIAQQGDVARVGRVPALRRDELGVLAHWTNAMIDRLEQTELQRAAVTASHEALNRTLEQRVGERTLRLAQVNASLAREMQTRSQMEIELRQAQKLEAVGRLAAGVAHEINTPVQFVSDSVHFVRDAMDDFETLIGVYRKLVGDSVDAREAEHAADLDYLLENVPKALERSIDGLQRLSTIVRSMKEFAHPDQKEMAAIDLNRAIQSTLTIARSEYKYVADVELALGVLPLVTCHGGDLNQVILNIVVNAAHAIGDAVSGTSNRGTIRVETREDGSSVVIAISDTGGGIPEAVRDRIFDPFFTTKDVGRGTGQGLAIARSVVVDKHGGELTFVCEMGKGTTFYVRLPIEGKASTAPGAIARA